MDTETRRIVTEEVWRSAAWAFLALIGWSVLVTTTPLPATALTVVGLPVLTVAVLAATMIGVRLLTGRELKAQNEGQEVLTLVVGILVFGFLALYLVLTEYAGWWLFALYLASVPVGLGIRSLLRKRYPSSFGVE